MTAQPGKPSEVVVADAPVAQVTPMALVQMAVQQGANVEQLAKLWELQQSWEADQARKAYMLALTQFKADAPTIIKTKAVSFGTGKTSYKHADAGIASEQIGHALAKHGLSHRWEVQQEAAGLIKVTCILQHSAGHCERVTMQATPDTSGSKNSIQSVGSTTAYLSRYTLLAATGLVPKDADTDGLVAGKKEMPQSQRADFEAAIQAVEDLPGWNTLWQAILAASTATGDVETHEHLRGLMVKRRKGLKE
jgi:hypothetical protein